jgi:hypothetical protein
MAMDDGHELLYFNPLLDPKKVSPFPQQRVDFKRVGWCHRPQWPWTMTMNLFILTRRWTQKKYHRSRDDESTSNRLVGAIDHNGHGR